MKPYQLQQPNGEWVDLDTIQSIRPPSIESRYPGFDTVILQWRHAFQAEPRELTWQQPLERVNGAEEDFVSGSWSRKQIEQPVKGQKGGPSVLEHVQESIFEPFLQAWKNRDCSK